jgi:hypothetical protein
MSEREYPTAGTPSKTTEVLTSFNSLDQLEAKWRCWNCNAKSATAVMGGYEDTAVMNRLRREAKDHAAACDL